MAKKQQRPFKRLRVMAEYGSSGIWAAEQVGPFRHGMVRHARLGLPHDLSVRFEAWIDRYWKNLDGGLDVKAFNTEGLELARAFKRHVGSETEVLFAPEREDGGQLLDQGIET